MAFLSGYTTRRKITIDKSKIDSDLTDFPVLVKLTSSNFDFSTDQKQKVTLTANTMTLTLDTTNVKVGNYILKIVNGGLATLTWASESGSIYWAGKTKPTLTSSGTDIVAFYFDGTNWYGMASLNFGTPS